MAGGSVAVTGRVNSRNRRTPSERVEAHVQKVFISYHHRRDQAYRDRLLELNRQHGMCVGGSVDRGDIDDGLPDQTIRQLIRDGYLRDTTVTVLLVGAETCRRKHVDWEIYSSMFDGV